jgi:hypothetical protein
MARWLPVAVAAACLLLALAAPVHAASDSLQRYPEDLVSAGSDVHLHPGDSVDRDVICFGCSVDLDGARVGRDVVAIGGSVRMTDGRVGRDVVAVGGGVVLTGSASVGRDASSTGGGVSVKDQASVGRGASAFGGRVSTAPGAHVGTVATGGGHVLPPRGSMPLPVSPARASLTGPDLLSLWTFGNLAPALAFVLLSLLLLWVFPNQVVATGRLAAGRPVASFGLGCLGVVLVAALAVLFALTLVGIAVSALLLLGLVAAWVLGWTAIFVALGHRVIAAVRSGPGDELPALLVGGVLVSVLWVLPVVNVVVGVAGGCVAIGAALGSRFGTRVPSQRLLRPPPVPPAMPPTPPPP